MRSSITLLLLWVFALAGRSIHAADRAQPNIVYILADDLGWTDTAVYGSKYYETPNIDRLATQGVRMMRYYNSQNCAPTRAVLMSGQYAPRTGVYSVSTLERGEAADRAMRVPVNVNNLPLDKFILPQALKAAGYATGMFGKWHLGNDGAHHPARRGFDEAIVSMGKHFKFSTNPKVEYPAEQYFADFLTDRAVDFISRHQAHPFFLYLPHYAVHVPIEARADYEAAWKKKPARGTHWDPTYAAMIQSVDDSVGRIMAQLDELALAQNTVLIFSSDNGGVGGYARTEPPSARKGYTDNEPLRGGKGTLYEGGIRVPFIVRWPGVVPAGVISNSVAAHVDLYPTLLEIAGGRAPANYPLDGVSFLPALRQPGVEMKRGPIFWHFPGYLESYVHDRGWRMTPTGAMHDGDFKLLEFFETSRVELYNVREDVGEYNDLAPQRPAQVAELRAKLAAWRQEVGAAMPTMKTAAERAADATATKGPARKKAID